MAAPAPVNNAFTPAQLGIIRSIPGSAESLAAIDGADGYDAVFDNLVAAIGRANDNPVDYTAVTGRLSMLNRRLTQRLERIRARFEYYAGVEGLSLQLLEKLANAKLLFNLAMGRLNRGVIGEPEFNAVVNRLEGFVAELDAVVPPPDGGYPEPPPDGAAPGAGAPGGGAAVIDAGRANQAAVLDDGANIGAVEPRNGIPPQDLALLAQAGEARRRGAVFNPDLDALRNNDAGAGGRKRKSKRSSKRKMRKTRTKTKKYRKQRGGFRYVTKPKTKKHSSSSSSLPSTSSTISSRN
jgi:hypothetical protein